METFTTLRGPKPLTYDVFISCGDDTLFSFTGFLAHSLNDRGFYTCINHTESIQNCKIFIFIISHGYVSRLDQLVNIMDQFAKGNYGPRRWILPVFYHVNPSDVRNQTGAFGEAFDSVCKNFLIHDRDRFQNLISLLRQVADFYGWHLDRARGIYEHQYIDEILQEVSKHVACSIGLDRRIEKVMDCLNSGSNDDRVRVVGIYGGPGLGKTTLARGVYHFGGGIEFDYCCFFDKVGKYVMKHGLVHLLRMLLYEIVGHHNSTMFENVDEGMLSTIKHMLNQKKVFLILEDIHNSEVFKVIVQLTTFVGSGSRFIITTKDKYLLQLHGIERIYEVERLDNKEAFQFLNLKAFNSMNFKPSNLRILERAATYASGHPFVLEIIGSHLRGKGAEECESALGQYEMIPNHEIQKILQISFDALGKYRQRMLIRIVIQLQGRELGQVEDTLHKFYGVCPKIDIRVLLDKSFIKINELGQVTLHCLTLDMVRYNASLEYPRKHSRLPTDILEENMEYSCKRSRFSKDTLDENMVRLISMV